MSNNATITEILKMQYTPYEDVEILKYLWKSEKEPVMKLINLFQYGRIQGIRQERQRRKAAASNE